jgi:hypothetical protein
MLLCTRPKYIELECADGVTESVLEIAIYWLSRIRSIDPVQFLSAVNLEQHIFFPSHYNPNDFCLLNCLSRDIHHFPFPAMRQFNPDNAQEIRKRAKYTSNSCCGVILLRGMPHEFCYNHFREWIHTNLRPSMDKQLLNRMVQFTAANSNFPRI